MRTLLRNLLSRMASWLRRVALRIEPHEEEASTAPQLTDGPPEHWLEKVRAGAPHLLTSGMQHYRATSGRKVRGGEAERRATGKAPMAETHGAPATPVPEVKTVAPFVPPPVQKRELMESTAQTQPVPPTRRAPRLVRYEPPSLPTASVAKTHYPDVRIRNGATSGPAELKAPVNSGFVAPTPTPSPATDDDRRPTSANEPVVLRGESTLRMSQATAPGSMTPVNTSPAIRSPLASLPAAKLGSVAEEMPVVRKRLRWSTAVLSTDAESGRFPSTPRQLRSHRPLPSAPPADVSGNSFSAPRMDPWPELPARRNDSASDAWVERQQEQKHRERLNREQRGETWIA